MSSTATARLSSLELGQSCRFCDIETAPNSAFCSENEWHDGCWHDGRWHATWKNCCIDCASFVPVLQRTPMGILIAVGLPTAIGVSITGASSTSVSNDTMSISPSSSKATSVFVDSVREFMRQLQNGVMNGTIAGKVEIIPMVYWGKSVPALNALVETAADHFLVCCFNLLRLKWRGVDTLELRPRTRYCRWSGIAQPCLPVRPECGAIGFEIIDFAVEYLGALKLGTINQDRVRYDGRRITSGSRRCRPRRWGRGVSTISMYQQLFVNTSSPTRVKLVQVTCVVWQAVEFKDLKRVARHTMKMRSKKLRLPPK